MEFKKIYLVRHGKIGMNDEQKYFIGQTDLPLNEEGRGQALRLGEILCRTKISSVFCSDLIRSAATAEKISSYHGLTPVVMPELREISLGDWDGLAFSEVISRYPDEFGQRGADIVNFRPPNGESFYDCGKRVITAFEDIVHTSKGNIVIAGHAGVNRLILCHVLNLPVENLFNISQDYGCLNIIFAGHSRYRLTLLNETGCF
jgi:probable phosphoglycerate mutase